MSPQRIVLRLAVKIALLVVGSKESISFAAEPIAEPDAANAWSVFITNGNCPDYAWGIRPYGLACIKLLSAGSPTEQWWQEPNRSGSKGLTKRLHELERRNGL